MTVSSTTATTPSPSPTTSTKQAESAMLGKDDFLKLLVSQLQHQDPMNPGDSKDFMSQMAQFTSVEQLTNMSTSFERMSTASQSTQSIALIGKTVGWAKADGSSGEGIAKSVSFVDGEITISVGDDKIAPGDIENVR